MGVMGGTARRGVEVTGWGVAMDGRERGETGEGGCQLGTMQWLVEIGGGGGHSSEEQRSLQR